mmetsp:Transcript_107716/g.208626  ORF Transcript_107716/g.208626 Transcript_107716/m.208626 type:complete len:356 (+) Transcript_107716:56-1123(+)
MVSYARLDWLLQQLHSGRCATVHMTYNPKTVTEKVKFTLEAASSHGTQMVYRPCVMAALQGVQLAMSYSVVSDKGHTNSLQKSVVEFWIKQPPSNTGDARAAGDGHSAGKNRTDELGEHSGDNAGNDEGDPAQGNDKLPGIHDISDMVAVTADMPASMGACSSTLSPDADVFISNANCPDKDDANPDGGATCVGMDSSSVSAADLAANRHSVTTAIVHGVERYYDEQLKMLRGKVCVWPPLRDMAEDEAIEKIWSMLHAGACSTIDPIIQERLPDMKEEERQMFDSAAENSFRTGITKWKSFARSCQDSCSAAPATPAEDAAMKWPSKFLPISKRIGQNQQVKGSRPSGKKQKRR